MTTVKDDSLQPHVEKAQDSPQKPVYKPKSTKSELKAPSAELLARVNLMNLYPPFRAKIEAAVLACEKQGKNFYLTSAYRDFTEQAALYAQGRTKPGKKVTQAGPGQSSHNYGIAVDATADLDANKAGLQPDWNDDSYEVWAKAVEAQGLTSGRRWRFRDSPHGELNLAKNGLDLPKLKAIHDKGGVQAVWKFLDQFSW